MKIKLKAVVDAYGQEQPYPYGEILRAFREDSDRFMVTWDPHPGNYDIITLGNTESDSLRLKDEPPYLSLDEWYGSEQNSHYYSIITFGLFEVVQDLIKEVNSGDLSKLPELLNTFYEYEKRAFHDNGQP